MIGTKCDLVDNEEIIMEQKKNKETSITKEEGKALAKKIKAVGYYETSAKTGEGVKEAFEAAVRASNTPRKLSIFSCFTSKCIS